jgi:signal transduction histidine kinase
VAIRPVSGAGNASPTQLETFVALVAHEVRTPLSVVKTAVAMLAEIESGGPTRPEVRQHLLAMVERNVDLAILLVDRMALAREIENGAIALTTELMDLVSVVRESIGDLRGAVLRDHPMELVAVDVLPVNADPTAVREIVFNLLSNAAKYSAREAPISIALDRCNATARMVVLDHGGGVPPGETEHIFEKFFQADPGSSGVGLGLFVARGLARAHGGDLTVRSAQDVGSEFVLELPAA